MLDVWIPSEDQEVTVDARTKSRTIHTGLNYPDGSQGFIIIGRMGNVGWEPTKTIKKVIIEYYGEPVEEQAVGEQITIEQSIEANNSTISSGLQNGGDKSGGVGDGEQANGVGQRSGIPDRKRSIRPKKGR